MDEPASILQNNSNLKHNNYLRIKLEGPKNNINGIGAMVKIHTSNGIQTFENYAIRGYQSSVQPRHTCWLARLDTRRLYRITWPGAKTQVIYPSEMNREISIKYSDAEERPQKVKKYLVTICIKYNYRWNRT